MPIVLEKSAKALAFEKSIYLLVVVIVGGVFSAPYFMDVELDLMWKIIPAVVILIAILIFVKILREIIAVLKSGEAWRVTITDEKLSWFSPIPEQMESFEVQLDDIQAVHRTHTRYRNSKRSPKTEFHIEFVNGQMLELKPQMCGVNPQKVFKALEEKEWFFTNTLKLKGQNYGLVMVTFLSGLTAAVIKPN